MLDIVEGRAVVTWVTLFLLGDRDRSCKDYGELDCDHYCNKVNSIGKGRGQGKVEILWVSWGLRGIPNNKC